MYFLLDICENPDILRIIYFVKKILDIIFIIVPIGLIVILSIDIFKMITAGDEKEVKNNQKMIINRLIFAIALFFVPIIVSVVMNLLSTVGFNVPYMKCIENAEKEEIERLTIEVANEALNTAKQQTTYQTIQDAKNAIDKIKNKDTKEDLKSQLEVLEKQYKQSQQNPGKDNNNTGNNSGNNNSGNNNSGNNSGNNNSGNNNSGNNNGNNSDNNNSNNNTDNSDNKDNNNTTDTGFQNYGSNGIKGSYFAPIQIKVNNYGSKSSTSGCNNSVYHDASGISEGTPIYAGIDGTAEFYQRYCPTNNQLYSYGNMVKITASNGTYIIYAHLKEYPDNVLNSSTNGNYITKTCPKKSDGSAPCPSNSCSDKIKSNVIAKMKVKEGDLIGYVGNTGNSTGTHLHVEIHPNGSKTCVENPWQAFGMK